MTVKIDKKITGYKVITEADKEKQIAEAEELAKSKLETLHEAIQRPETLVGMTYKVSTQLSEHALYITINDIVLNEGTEHQTRHPYEVFLNSKNMEHYQWVVALTRVISAVFRKGGDVCFLVDELKQVFDPKGGYLKKGGVYMPSLVAEIGHTLEEHLMRIGLIDRPALTTAQQEVIEEKKKEHEEKTGETTNDGEFPESAQVCIHCNTKAAIILDNCLTCLNCGASKCG